MRLVLNVRDGQVARTHFDSGARPDGDYVITFPEEALDAPIEYPVCDNPDPHEGHQYGSVNDTHGGRCPGRTGEVTSADDDVFDDDDDA